jgi:hypothetical protein
MKAVDLIAEYNDGRRDFAGALIEGRNLSEVDLSGIDLAGVCFADDTNLSGANFTGANLRKARLNGLTCIETNFTGANMREARLSNGGCYKRANFTDAILNEAHCIRSNFSEADFTRASLKGVDFMEATLNFANFTVANMTLVNLAGAHTNGVILRGAMGIVSAEEEMVMLKRLLERIEADKDAFDLSQWHSEDWDEDEYADSAPEEQLEEFLFQIAGCNTTHCAAGFVQLFLAEDGNAEAVAQRPSTVGSANIPSLAHLFFSKSEDDFLVYLKDLVEGRKPLLAR